MEEKVIFVNSAIKGKLFLITKTGVEVYNFGDHYRFTLPPTDGKTGTEWFEYFKNKDYRPYNAKSVLLSEDFKATNGVVYEIVVLKGKTINDRDRSNANIRTEALNRDLKTPNAEIACLIRDNFTDEELEVMHLVLIMVMHEPIQDFRDTPRLLCSCSNKGGGRSLGARYDGPEHRVCRESGFAFCVS